MTDAGKEKQDDVREDATDARTLDEIEADQKVPVSDPESSVPSPDEGGGRDDDSNSDGVE